MFIAVASRSRLQAVFNTLIKGATSTSEWVTFALKTRYRTMHGGLNERRRVFEDPGDLFEEKGVKMHGKSRIEGSKITTILRPSRVSFRIFSTTMGDFHTALTHNPARLSA